MNVEDGRRGSETRLDEVSAHVRAGDVRPAVSDLFPGSATTLETRLARSRAQMLMTLDLLLMSPSPPGPASPGSGANPQRKPLRAAPALAVRIPLTSDMPRRPEQEASDEDPD